MVKKHDIINLIILLFYLFSFGKTELIKWVDFNPSLNYAEEKLSDASKREIFGVDFKGQISKIQFYMKVQVTSEDENPAPRLCFSSKNMECVPQEQLVKNPNDKVVIMWLKREEFNKDDEELYVVVESANDKCKYTISFEGAPQPTFGPNFVYSYLVNSYNREMRFDVEGTETNAYLTISLDGSSKATLSADNVYREGIKYKSGTIFTFYLENSGLKATNLASITVRNAEVGEYITISAHIVNTTDPCEGLASNEYLLPNGPEISGYLEEGVLNEECFPLDLTNSKYRSMNKLYITGRIHTKYGWFFLEDEHRKYLEETDVEIFDGHLAYVMKNNGKMNYVCLELPSEVSFKMTRMAFSILLTATDELASIYNYYPPQLVGDIYRRIIPKNTIAVFSGTKNDNTAKKFDYNLYQRKGLTKMYIAHCKNYPDCHYTQTDLQNLIEPEPVNQMTIWTTYDDKSSAIDKEKFLIVAYCQDDDNESNGYCEFETSITNKGQDIYLVEDEKFSKYVIKDEKGKFIADIQSGRQIQRLTFDIMIFSGDVTFNCYNKVTNNKLSDEEIQTSFDKYYLSNKIYYHINLAQLTAEQIVVEYKAEINSFFTIQFNVDSYNIEQLEENVPSGESYLVQINPNSANKKKTIKLSNRFYKNNKLFLANFFELNCEFEVTRGEVPVDIFDGYGQEVLSSTSEGYKSDSYEYSIKIVEADSSNYNHKMCMLYIAGYEDDSQRDIIVGENINQQIVFEDDFKKIRFLYPHADPNKDLAVHVNVIDKAFYKIIFFANNNNIKEMTITRSQIIYLKGSVIMNKCDENTLCPIVVQVEYDKEIIKTNPMIEITIREIKNTPTYLQKGQAKLDFVCGDRFYYLYTDVGKNEVGEVTVNFLREFGNVWGRIVRKDQSFVDEEANWRGKYRMPSEDWEDSLPIDKYTKKLFVNAQDTADCIEGCYLLLSVQISQIGEYVEDYKFYPFSIITKITPNNKAYTDIPKVIIQVDEFIIGAVDIASNERIYEFYEVWLPHDSDIVEFDWQSSVAGLYINLGGSRPTTKNAHFKLTPRGKDTILKLNKEDILNKAKSLDIKTPYSNSIQDVNLVIGVWTDKSDSINTELYSLRVHQPESDSENLDIIQINTDQKIMCTPIEIGSTSQYRCLFVVTYDDEDVNMFTPLLAYAGSTNYGALTYMFADYIDRDIYDQFIKKDLSSNIPTYQTCEDFNTQKTGIDYIYTSFLQKGKYMYINVVTDKPDPLMIVTNMPVYNYISYDLFEFYPNPTTEQLLSIPGEQLRLSFPGTDSIMVNIVTLKGHAEVSWKSEPDKKFVLRGVGDRLSLSSGEKNDQLVIHKLSTESINSNDKLKMEDAGFTFYISYHKMSLEKKNAFEEVNYGQSIEMAFKDTDLPLVLYNKLGVKYNDINIAITFKDNEIEKEGVHEFNPLLISAILVKEKSIYDCKKDREITPPIERSVIGNYDTALKTAQVFLSEERIKNYNIKAEDNPTVYVRIDKMGEFIDKTFDKFSVEAQISGVNDGVIPVEKVYHYGRVRNSVWTSNFYRLRVDKQKPLMRVQIAFNSNNLYFLITDTVNGRRNISFTGLETAGGKTSVTIKVDQEKNFYYLYILKRERTVHEEYLNNYAFKYITGKTIYDFFDYPILDSPEITIQESKENEEDIIKCTFNKLDIEDGKANVTYFFKVVENMTHIYGEEINTIAVTESEYYSVYERNPKANNGKITLTARGRLSNWAYLNVIAQVQQNNVLEYVAYNGKKCIRPYENQGKKQSSSDNTTMFVVVGVILILIVIGLIVTIFIFQQKNKNLLNQVKHVSFQQTNTSTNVDPNLLLQKSQSNPQSINQ